jgi:hyperosmotically inducible periplasmic protein
MKTSVGFKIIVPMLVFGMAAAAPIFAEDADTSAPGSASSSMHHAGESMENAASSTGHAVSNAYHGTVTAMSDTKITAKVKRDLHEGKVTKGGDIDVDTVNGIVTLHGTVRSASASAKATRIARNTEGVKGVTNNLTMASAAH